MVRIVVTFYSLLIFWVLPLTKGREGNYVPLNAVDLYVLAIEFLDFTSDTSTSALSSTCPVRCGY